MTGKRAADFLASTNRLQATSSARAALQRAMASVAEPKIEDNRTRWGHGGGKVECRKRDKVTAVVAARKRAAKWTKDERDLAERELAAAIVETAGDGLFDRVVSKLSPRQSAKSRRHDGAPRRLS